MFRGQKHRSGLQVHLLATRETHQTRKQVLYFADSSRMYIRNQSGCYAVGLWFEKDAVFARRGTAQVEAAQTGTDRALQIASTREPGKTSFWWV